MDSGKKEGQIALIVLLVMIVVLTIGLSLASRSVTDVKISTDEKEAYRAFSAAEAGIEDALNNIQIYAQAGSSGQDFPVGDLTTHVTALPTAEGATQVIERNEVMNVKMPDDNPQGLTINWTDTTDTIENSSPRAGIEISIYFDDYSIKRHTYNARGEDTGNEFSNSQAGDAGFHSKVAHVSLVSGTRLPKLVRIKALFNKATIKVESQMGNLPILQYNITSRASSENNKQGAFSVSRTVSVLPNIFDYTLFTHGGDLVR